MIDLQTKPQHLFNIRKLATSSMTHNIFIYSFALLYLIGEMRGNLHLIYLKPIPIIFMILKSVRAVECDSNITIGLLLGLTGDVCLMFPTTLLFEVGAIFFLFGHISYIRAFLQKYESPQISLNMQKLVPLISSVIIYMVLCINVCILWNSVPDKGLFVMYGIVLSLMCSLSLYRLKQVRSYNYWIGVSGGICFVISDYLIAFSKFKGYETDMKGTLIMLLYYSGQFMILKGNSVHKQIKGSRQQQMNK